MHPKNPHQSHYDFPSLLVLTPELSSYIIKNPLNQDTIDFSNPQAVRILNKALLKKFYGVNFWDLPQDFLCPPIPGRADYIYYLADLLAGIKDCRGLDIGTGASCIYPLIGNAAWGWKFTGTDINPAALKCAQNIINLNKLSNELNLRLQSDPGLIFEGVIEQNDYFHFTMCNPPFHSSQVEAAKGSARKWKNLGKKNSGLNFGGISHELWCQGGERAFITQMMMESVAFKQNCLWFTSLVSKAENLPPLLRFLEKIKPAKVKTIEMKQGQKKARFIAWSFQHR
jgi:23S rRNA (adenine1618-N6)-methyltransferase